jgi:acetylornithine deacetylase
MRGKIAHEAESLYQETVDLIIDLIKIPSESPNYLYAPLYEERGYSEMYDEPMTLGGEKKVAERLEPVMKALGAETAMEAKEPLRPNLIGIFPGVGGGRSLAMNAHTDTVPTGPHEEWR